MDDVVWDQFEIENADELEIMTQMEQELSSETNSKNVLSKLLPPSKTDEDLLGPQDSFSMVVPMKSGAASTSCPTDFSCMMEVSSAERETPACEAVGASMELFSQDGNVLMSELGIMSKSSLPIDESSNLVGGGASLQSNGPTFKKRRLTRGFSRDDTEDMSSIPLAQFDPLPASCTGSSNFLADIEKIKHRRELRKRQMFLESRGSRHSRDHTDLSCGGRSGPTYHRPPFSRLKDYVPMTLVGATRPFYLSLRPEQGDASSLKQSVQKTSFQEFALLSKSIEELMTEAEKMQHQKAIDRAERIMEFDLDENLVPGGTKDVDRGSNGSVPDAQLWVDKYRPTRYTELLSCEGINRTLLTWLNFWDECVFGGSGNQKKKTRMRLKMEQGVAGEEDEAEKGIDRRKKFDSNRKFDSSRKFDPASNSFKHKLQDSDELDATLDEYKRPLNKVALLCGPPGLGKTTLAHVISQHACYNVVELNASDDRSVENFRNYIESSTQMKACFTRNPSGSAFATARPSSKPGRPGAGLSKLNSSTAPRPNCLVIDEIDGAPAPAINYLVSVIKAKRSGKRSFYLRRPVVCICNNLYTPALRELRKLALVLHFPETDPLRLTSRLMLICKREEMPIESSTLTTLCEKSVNDIRSCVNTLQMFHKQKRRLGVEELMKGDIGRKNIHKDLFTVWREVFTLTAEQSSRSIPFKRRLLSEDTQSQSGLRDSWLASKKISEDQGSLSSRFNKIYHSSLSCDQRDKMMEGIFENYLAVPSKQSGMKSRAMGLDWFTFADLLTTQINENQNWALMGYQNFLPVIIHLLFATDKSAKLQYPFAPAEAYMKQTQSSQILQSLQSDMHPSVRSFVQPIMIVLDLVPYLCAIVAPMFRSVSIQFYNSKEKQELCRLIGVMLTYNLTYRQQRTNDGQYEFVFEPSIEELINFSSTKLRFRLSYTLRQLIAREIELEKARRVEPTAKYHNLPEGGHQGASVSKHDRSDCGIVASTSKTPNPLNNRKERPSDAKPGLPSGAHSGGVVTGGKLFMDKKSAPVEVKPMRDFFGRIITPSEKAGDTNDLNSSKDTSDLFFKFKSGYINAVRKNIRMRDLL